MSRRTVGGGIVAALNGPPIVRFVPKIEMIWPCASWWFGGVLKVALLTMPPEKTTGADAGTIVVTSLPVFEGDPPPVTVTEFVTVVKVPAVSLQTEFAHR